MELSILVKISKLLFNLEGVGYKLKMYLQHRLLKQYKVKLHKIKQHR